MPSHISCQVVVREYRSTVGGLEFTFAIPIGHLCPLSLLQQELQGRPDPGPFQPPSKTPRGRKRRTETTSQQDARSAGSYDEDSLGYSYDEYEDDVDEEDLEQGGRGAAAAQRPSSANGGGGKRSGGGGGYDGGGRDGGGAGVNRIGGGGYGVGGYGQDGGGGGRDGGGGNRSGGGSGRDSSDSAGVPGFHQSQQQQQEQQQRQGLGAASRSLMLKTLASGSAGTVRRADSDGVQRQGGGPLAAPAGARGATPGAQGGSAGGFDGQGQPVVVEVTCGNLEGRFNMTL
jgi:hypothetical protein